MYLKDAPFHTLLVMEERMDNEIRRMYYVRREGEARHKNFVNTFGVATVQGSLWRP